MAISHAMRKFYENDMLIEQYRSKQISAEDLDRYMAMANIQTKLLTVEIAAQKVACNDNKTLKRLQNSGFISTTSIPVAREVAEVFPCPEQGGCNIARGDCLDYSGDSRHIDNCQRCEQFDATRKQVCPHPVKVRGDE